MCEVEINSGSNDTKDFLVISIANVSKAISKSVSWVILVINIAKKSLMISKQFTYSTLSDPAFDRIHQWYVCWGSLRPVTAFNSMLRGVTGRYIGADPRAAAALFGRYNGAPVHVRPYPSTITRARTAARAWPSLRDPNGSPPPHINKKVAGGVCPLPLSGPQGHHSLKYIWDPHTGS